jgi:hypothetical protein
LLISLFFLGDFPAISGEDGDFLWDEQVFLMVDHLDQQLLLVQLQERHTWNHDRVFAHQAPAPGLLVDGRLGGIIPQKLLEDPHDMSGTGPFLLRSMATFITI